MSIVLAPFFSYYGSKQRASGKYPLPKYDTIIEPFAGSAGYSLRYNSRKIILYDIDPVICGVWDYLIRTPESEILALPAKVDHVDDLHCCQEAKWLIGFWLHRGSTYPMYRKCGWMLQTDHPKKRKLVAGSILG